MARLATITLVSATVNIPAFCDGHRGQLWVRTFAAITTNANDLLRPIQDRMPVIIAPIDYHRWLSPLDPDPRDLLVQFPSDPMTMWAMSTRVNKPENRVDEPVGVVEK